MMKRFLHSIAFLLSLHVLGLVWLSLLRLLFFVFNHSLLSVEAEGDWGLQSIAFLRGLWFDNVIGCYILILPLAVAVVGVQFPVSLRKLYTFQLRFMQVLYGLSFAISAANIPYFRYFFKNINSSIFNWFEYGFTTLGMVFGEWTYYPPIILFVLFLFSFVFLTNRCLKRFLQWSEGDKPFRSWQSRLTALLSGAALVGLCLFGIRGRMGYNPIKVSAAYYCEDPLLNQLGVNATFNLLTSTLDEMRPENKRLHLMDDAEAIKDVQRYLGRTGREDISPLYRELQADRASCDKRPNVVIILMESMSANLMQTFGQTKRLTPFLDSLFCQSLAFRRAYSAGIHTNHGLYATLYSWPAIMKRNLMKGSNIPVYSGLPTVLKSNGYQNLFFMTHESQYDNMNAFFRTNGFDEIYSQEDYPRDKIVNSFGVQDDFLYSYALNVFNEKVKGGQPFFATLLSISNHPPYIIPEKFHPHSQDKEDQIVEYADWALRQFFDEARKQSWFKNTLFVLEADHGKLVGRAENEMPASFNHIPLLFYASWLKPEQCDDWATQMDVQPTLMHLLGLGGAQNNYGVDLLSPAEARPMVFYTADDMIGARTEDLLYFYNPETNQEYCYMLSEGGMMRRVEKTDNAGFDRCQHYVFSMIQSAEALVRQGKTIDHP